MMKNHLMPICPLILGLLLLSCLPTSGEAPIKLKVTAELANIRENPDIGSAILSQLPQGTILEAETKEGEWFKVQLKQEEGTLVIGYVHESLVMVLEAPLPKEEKKIGKKEEIKQEPAREEKKPVPPPPPPQLVPPSQEPRAAAFSLSFWGGGNFLSVGDLNDGAQGLAQFYGDALGKDRNGEVSFLRFGPSAGAEFGLPLSSQVALSIGADFLFAQKESSVLYEKGTAKDKLITRPRIQAIPINLALAYYPLPFFYAKLGVEYYLAECRYFYRLERPDSWHQWEGKATARGLGFHGGLGLEWEFQKSLALALEVAGRFAKIKGFEGKNTLRDSSGGLTDEEGKLYYFMGKSSGTNSYPLVFIREKKPSEAGVSEPRDAEVDFTGIKIKLGIRIKF